MLSVLLTMQSRTCLAFLFLRIICVQNDYQQVETPVFYIVGGKAVKFDEFPFMAALGWENNVTGDIDYLGGGMLIAPNLVLTAAHCTFIKQKLPDRVTIGGNPLNGYQNDIYKVRNYSIYPEYQQNRAYHDISILVLDEMTGRPPVCIWTQPILNSPNVTAIGFGATKFAGGKSQELLKVDLLVYSETLCKPYIRRQRKFPSGLLPSQLCAGDPEMRRDTCQGDSGGPLIYDYKGKKYAVGITSTGQACSGFPPAIYTRISSYLPWIQEKAKEHGYSIRDNCDQTETEQGNVE